MDKAVCVRVKSNGRIRTRHTQRAGAAGFRLEAAAGLAGVRSAQLGSRVASRRLAGPGRRPLWRRFPGRSARSLHAPRVHVPVVVRGDGVAEHLLFVVFEHGFDRVRPVLVLRAAQQERRAGAVRVRHTSQAHARAPPAVAWRWVVVCGRRCARVCVAAAAGGGRAGVCVWCVWCVWCACVCVCVWWWWWWWWWWDGTQATVASTQRARRPIASRLVTSRRRSRWPPLRRPGQHHAARWRHERTLKSPRVKPFLAECLIRQCWCVRSSTHDTTLPFVFEDDRTRNAPSCVPSTFSACSLLSLPWKKLCMCGNVSGILRPQRQRRRARWSARAMGQCAPAPQRTRQRPGSSAVFVATVDCAPRRNDSACALRTRCLRCTCVMLCQPLPAAGCT